MKKKQPNAQRTRSLFGAKFTATISIALVLFILGTVVLFGFATARLSNYVTENIGLNMVLKEDASESQIERLHKTLKESDYMRECRYISKEDALEELIEELGEDPKTFLGYNPLSASFEIKVNPLYANNDSLEMITQELTAHPLAQEVSYQRDLVQSINKNIKRVGTVLLALAIVLMIISFALISNTIRLMVHSHRFLIHTMRLVGATPGFIRRPFIWSNVWHGIIASILALGLLWGTAHYVKLETSIDLLGDVQTILYVAGSVMLLGIVLSALSAYIAVTRFLRMNRDSLYYV